MKSALAQTVRLIEYPDNLSGCYSLDFNGRQLMYLCSRIGRTQFVVVLGFYMGQREDVVTKNLVEPVHESIREEITCRLAPSCSQAHIFFL